MEKYKDLVEEEKSPDGNYIRYNKKLGSGAYKTVYLGYDTDRGIDVAWNVVSLRGIPEREQRRIAKETQILKSLRHPNIIDFYHVWENEDDETIVFTTEIVSSGTLKDFAKRSKDRPKLKLIKKWCRQILDVLKYLHSRAPPVIHRDLKCDNIFINGSNGELKVGDLGLSTSKLRPLKTVLGTPEFMAPEMYEENYNELIDIYAFGMCVLELCTNKYPYEECINPAQVYKKVVAGEKPKILSKILNPKTRSFIDQCLTKVEQRLNSAELLRHPFLRFDSLNDSFAVQMAPDSSETDQPQPKNGKKKKAAKKTFKRGSILQKSFSSEETGVKFVLLHGKNCGSKQKERAKTKKKFFAKGGDSYYSDSADMLELSSSFEPNPVEEEEEKKADEEALESIVFSEDESFFEDKKRREASKNGKKAEFRLIKPPTATTGGCKNGKTDVVLKMVYDDNKKRNVRFPFDFNNDTLGVIWGEMKRDLKLSDKDCNLILNVLKKALKKAKSREKKTKKPKIKTKTDKNPGGKKAKRRASETSKEYEEDGAQSDSRELISRPSFKLERIKSNIEKSEKKGRKEAGLVDFMDGEECASIEGDGPGKGESEKAVKGQDETARNGRVGDEYKFRSMDDKQLLERFLLQDLNQKLLLYYKCLDVFSKSQLQFKLGKDAKDGSDPKPKYFRKAVLNSIEEIANNPAKFEKTYNSPLALFQQNHLKLSNRCCQKINEPNLKMLGGNIESYQRVLEEQQRDLSILKKTTKEALTLISLNKISASRWSVPSSANPKKNNLPDNVLPEIRAENLTGEGASRHIAACLHTADSEENLRDVAQNSSSSFAKANSDLLEFCRLIAPSKSAFLKKELRQRKDKFSHRTSQAMKAELDVGRSVKATQKIADGISDRNGKSKESQKELPSDVPGEGPGGRRQAEAKAKADAAEAEERLMEPILNFKKRPAKSAAPPAAHKEGKEETKETIY